MNRIKYRDHRGGFIESMETVRLFESTDQLFAHLDKTYGLGIKKVVEIKFKYIIKDERIAWETYYVLQRFKGEKTFAVAGMSNGQPEGHLFRLYFEKFRLG